MQKINIENAQQDNYQVRESYRNLRTNIFLSGKDTKVVMFTSCGPNEGKSTVTMNLASSIADGGKKVLFIDCDLRKSVLVGRYRVKKGIKGLTHFLSGQNTLEEVIYSTNVENMDVILAGPVPPNPAELLDSPLFKDTVKEMREKYDYVIIDTPPLGSVIDAAIVATVSDGAVLVIAANQVSYKFAQNVMEQLKKTKIKIIGSVLNKVDLSENGYYGKHYGKYYGKYYGSYYGNYHSEQSPDKSFEKAKEASAAKNSGSRSGSSSSSRTSSSSKNGKKPVAGSVGSVAARKNSHAQSSGGNKNNTANKPGSVNGVPLKKRGSRTEEYDGDFLLDMDFDDDNK